MPSIRKRYQKSPDDESCQLYRHFDGRGRLLYVGISLNAIWRLNQHVHSSAWTTDVSRVEIETLPTREAALAAELKAIKTENPVHNTVGREPLTVSIADDDTVIALYAAASAEGCTVDDVVRRALRSQLRSDGYKSQHEAAA